MFGRKAGNNGKIDIYSITALDIALIAFILLFTLAFVFRAGLTAIGNQSALSEAITYQEGHLFEHVDLRKDRKINLLEGKMSIRVQNGSIAIVKSDCPRKVCVNTGWISNPGDSIVCVPYQVIIEIRSGEKPGVDAVVY